MRPRVARFAILLAAITTMTVPAHRRRARAAPRRRQPARRADRGGERLRGRVGTTRCRRSSAPPARSRTRSPAARAPRCSPPPTWSIRRRWRTAGKSGPVVLFARNRLCALVRPGLAVTPATLLDRMLDPAVKLGTSTPRADPSGDYAWEVFRKADKLKPGAFATLETEGAATRRRSQQPTAPPGPQRSTACSSPKAGPTSSSTYCTNAREAAAGKIPASRSWRCRTSSRSAPTTD